MARCPDCGTNCESGWYAVSCQSCVNEWKAAADQTLHPITSAVQRLREWQPSARLIVQPDDPCPSCHKTGSFLFYTIDEGTGAYCGACGFSNACGDYSPIDGRCPDCGQKRTLHYAEDGGCSACREAVEAAKTKQPNVRIHTSAETRAWLENATPEQIGAFQRMIEGALEMAEKGNLPESSDYGLHCAECGGVIGSHTDYCTACQRHAGVYHAEGW